MATKKQIAKEIGKDIARKLTEAGRATGRGIAQVACKLSYPVLGNLSRNMQEKIEERLGKDYYNSIEAYQTSRGINYITRISSGAYLCGSLMHNSPSSNQEFAVVLGAIFGGTVAVAYTGFENLIREEKIRKRNPYGSKEACASLTGKLVSLPFEGMAYASDGVKNYLASVKRRIEAREQTASSLEQKADGEKK